MHLAISACDCWGFEPPAFFWSFLGPLSGSAIPVQFYLLKASCSLSAFLVIKFSICWREYELVLDPFFGPRRQ